MDSLSLSNSISKETKYENTELSTAYFEDLKGRGSDTISNERIQNGDRILETYEVTSDAIYGGMGSVWRVHHNSWNTDLAMKRPQPRFFAEGGDAKKAQFVAECENWINLGLHPNIVSCYYVREIGGVPTIFSEWMDGGSLSDRIKDGSLYEGTEDEIQERILDIAIQAARGLQYSHENGLIHQDFKPGNLLLTKEWDAKVADFGLSRAIEKPKQSKKRFLDYFKKDKNEKASVLGYTLAYCPKEQAEGEKAASWMDIYSWALTVLAMYAGNRRIETKNGNYLPIWQSGSEAKKYIDDCLSMCEYPVPEVMKDVITKCLKERLDGFTEIIAICNTIYYDITGRTYKRKNYERIKDTAAALNNRALSFLDLGKKEEALRLLRQAEKENPNCQEAVFNCAVLSWEDGSIDDIYVQNKILAIDTGGDSIKEQLHNEHREWIYSRRVKKVDRNRYVGNKIPNMSGVRTEGIVIASNNDVVDFSLDSDETAILWCRRNLHSKDMSGIEITDNKDLNSFSELVKWNLRTNKEEPIEHILSNNHDINRMEAPLHLVRVAMEKGWANEEVTCSTISNSGKWLLLGFNRKICMVEASTGRCVCTFTVSQYYDFCRVSFSADEKYIFGCQSGNVLGLFCWAVPDFNNDSFYEICKVESVAQRLTIEKEFNRITNRFSEYMAAKKYQEASDAIYEAQALSGFENDARITEMFSKIASDAVPTDLEEFQHILMMENTLGGGIRSKLLVSHDHKYAVLPNGKVWNLADNVCAEESNLHTRQLLADSKRFDKDYGITSEQKNRINECMNELYGETNGYPYSLLPDGVILAVGIPIYEKDACGIDFINLRSGKILCKKLIWRDPINFDLFPKDIDVTRDGRFLFCAFQHNGFSKGVLYKMKWRYD